MFKHEVDYVIFLAKYLLATQKFYLFVVNAKRHFFIHLLFELWITRVTTLKKAKLKKSNDQTNIYKNRIVAYNTEYHIALKIENHYGKVHDDKEIFSCKKIM